MPVLMENLPLNSKGVMVGSQSDRVMRPDKQAIKSGYAWIVIVDKSPPDCRFREGVAEFSLEEIYRMVSSKIIPVGSVFKNARTGELVRVTRNGLDKLGRRKCTTKHTNSTS